jgi:hypothetical protein
VAQLEQLLFSKDDTIFAGKQADVIHALAGNDTVFAGGGNDTVYGGLGIDTLYGGDGNDKLYGDDGADKLFAQNGNDFVYGGAGNDTLYGGDGKDIVNGGAGNDLIGGGYGADALTGGTGKDTFQYILAKESGPASSTRDTITDFTHGQDKIGISLMAGPAFHFLGQGPLTGQGQVDFKYAGADTLVQVSTDAGAAAEMTILLKGHIALTKGDFIL